MESLRAWHQTVFLGKRMSSPSCRLLWRMRPSRMLACGHLVALTLCTLLMGAGPLRAEGRGPNWSRWRPPLGERSRETFSDKSIEIDAAIDELRIIEKDPFLSAEDRAAVQRRIARLENLAVNTGYDEYSAAWREHEELMAKGRAEGRLSEEDARRAEQLRRTMRHAIAQTHHFCQFAGAPGTVGFRDALVQHGYLDVFKYVELRDQIVRLKDESDSRTANQR